MAPNAPKNSTNVRVESPLDPWPLPVAARRVPAVAPVLWTLFVAAAATQGVFARLDPEAYGALVLFVAAFTLLTAFVDAEVRAALEAMPHKPGRAVAVDALLLAGWMSHGAPASWTGLAGALALLVLLPLAVVLHAAAARGTRLRRAPGASPGAKRAAT